MIVVDTNIIGYLYLASDRSAEAEKALLKDPFWVAPLLWRSELCNVLALYLRKNLLNLEDAKSIMQDALSLMFEHEYETASNEVLEIANSCNLSAYDCEFVALARDLNLKLITVDKKIIKGFPDWAISLEDFIKS